MPDAPTSIPRGKLRAAGIAFVILAAAVAASGIVVRVSNAERLRERAEAQAIPTVAVIRPGAVGAAARLDLPGRLEAFARAPLYARVSGYVKAWNADIGAPVRKGQLLAEIETPELDQQLLQAKADLASAQASASQAASTSKRWQALVGTESVSKQEAEEKASDATNRQAAANAAQANLERMQALKGFARIVAPFDGTVTARATDVGALVNAGAGAGQELFVVSDTRRLRVYVNVPQAYVAKVRRGTAARIGVPERPGKSYTAAVESMAQAVNPASGSMLVQLLVDNAAGELLPGGFANVSLELPSEGGTLSVPPSALIFNQKGLRVATVVEGDKVLLKNVAVARDNGRAIEIASGLGAEDRVIESPPDGIADGDRVRIAAPAPAKPVAKDAPKDSKGAGK